MSTQQGNGIFSVQNSKTDTWKQNGTCMYNGNGVQKDHDTSNNPKQHAGELLSEMEAYEEVPILRAIFTYFTFIVFNLMGRLRDLMRGVGLEKNTQTADNPVNRDFVPLYQDYEAFYTRNLYRRVQDCYDRPLCGVAGVEIETMNRVSHDYCWTFEYPGGSTKKLNMGSYNYLGFAETTGHCTDSAQRAMSEAGLSSASTRQEVGSLVMHRELEELVAEYTGQEAAIVSPMGFATNALNIPALVDKHCCVISDELNHTSLILGIRLSGAQTRRFKHNDVASLEEELRSAIVVGNPRTRRPYKKILIVVEGIYSMEGSIVRLPEIIALKKRYKAYLYVDEAHSIGALGPHGRGVIDYFGCDPKDVDIAMGTFTKSFGAAGGYIAGSRRLIDYLACASHSSVYGTSMSPPVCHQIIASMSSLMGRPGHPNEIMRVRQLAWNTRYFRRALVRMGLFVYGHRDSPVVPVIICPPCNLVAFSRLAFERGLAIVIVGFPATTLLLARIRFCMCSSHTKEMLDKSLAIIYDISNMLGLRYSRLQTPKWALADIEPLPSAVHYTLQKQSDTAKEDEEMELKAYKRPHLNGIIQTKSNNHYASQHNHNNNTEIASAS